MAGASAAIDIEVDDAELKAALEQLAAKVRDLTPFFNDVGETLLNSTRERFRSQTAPDGTPWAALNPEYRRRKKRNADKVLTLWGHLRGTLVKQADENSLRIGTPLVYGATHQFGRGPIPARPFLGLSDDDRAALLDALRDYLGRD
jgi:phage virion morphogenesis protein